MKRFLGGMSKFTFVISVSSLIIATCAASTTAATALPQLATTANSVLAQGQKTSTVETTVEKDDFKFTLQSCQRIRQTVTCNLLITNVGNQDRNLGLYLPGSDVSSCRTFDSSGNEYIASSVQIGKSRSPAGYKAETTLIKNIPTKASVSFVLPQELTELAVVEVSYREPIGLSSTRGQAQFRNIKIVTSNSSTNTTTNRNQRKK